MLLINREHISNYKRMYACLKFKNGCYSSTRRGIILLERKDVDCSCTLRNANVIYSVHFGSIPFFYIAPKHNNSCVLVLYIVQ